jgi:hypothetical protein
VLSTNLGSGLEGGPPGPRRTPRSGYRPTASPRPIRTLALACLALLTLCSAAAQTGGARPLMRLEGADVRVTVDLAGGSIVEFAFRDQGLNPLVWEGPGGAADPRPRAHFLCLDRWGAPSKAEEANGMPFHGEATRVPWTATRQPAPAGDYVEAAMEARLPMAGLAVSRTVGVVHQGSCFRVTEQVTNLNPLGRIYNLVQHPTIGPPFLDASTVVDANARRGLMQSSPLPNPEEPLVWWPGALEEERAVNLRFLTDNPNPNVVSYVIDEPLGWVTASNPGRGLLIGYLWRVADYPWLNIWRHVVDGKPAARGLEFGTTGLHQPFGVLVRKGRIFDRALYEHLDAGETAAKSYGAFLAKIPPDWRGVARVGYHQDTLTITERGPGDLRELRLRAPRLLPD